VKAPFVPSSKAAGKCSNMLNSPAPQLKRYTCARELTGSGTVKDNLAITRHWYSSVVFGALSKPLRIDAHCAGNALMAPRTIPAAV